MKPLLLHLQNIGPFRSQSIDFTQLADMFLVCGKTGAGKSTIFNAITYALYGKLSGSHSQVNGARIRSDFASPDEEAVITFTFQLQDQCYQVRRELPRDCINRNGKTTTKPESVEVYRKNGDSLQLLSSQKKEADTTLADLLGLTVDEFARIIILPQGEFAEFLKQNSNQRRETLMKLFPLDGYERLMEAVKARSTEDTSRLRLMETQLQGFGDFDLQQQEEILVQYQRLLQDSQNQRNQLTEKQTGISVEIQACSQQLKDFLSHETLASKLELHVSSEDTVQRQRQHISLAERAAPVHAQIQSHQKTLRDLATAQSQLDLTTAALKELEAEKERLQQQEPAIQQLRESHSKNLLLEQELARGLETEGELHRLTQRKELITDELTKLQRQQESLAARQVELEVILSQLQQVSIQDLDSQLRQQSLLSSQELECKTSLANAREELSLQEKIIAQQQVVENSRQKAQSIQQEFHRQQQQLESLREQNMAQLLAATLQPGTPCPVCGSTSHHLPDRPATSHQQLPHHPQLEQLQETLRQLEQQRNSAVMESSREEGSLEQLLQQQASRSPQCPPQSIPQLEEQLEGIQQQKEQLERSISDLRQSIGRKEELATELESCRHQQEPLQRQCSSLQQELATMEGLIQAKESSIQQALGTAREAGFHQPTVEETHMTLCHWLKKAADSINQFDQQLDSIRQRHSQEQARLQERTAQLDRCQQEEREARRQMEASLQEAGFTTTEEALAAYLSQEEVHRLRAAIEAWQEELTRLKTQVEEIGRRLSGTKEEAEGRLAQLQAEGRHIQTQLAVLDDTYKAAFHQLEETRTRIERWKELEEQRQAAQRKAHLSSQLFTHISDKNPKKLALTTWILGVYLDQIVACANGRLQRISEGRYTLHFIQEKAGNGAKGLDLEILDSYTGKRRPCSTLSGGETFMVSISLALALTDVVSSRWGGISLQSLFIDEGFGSLDPGSLDKAMAILEEIREGRCVGVISHVTEMQSRIPSRLEVLKTTTGSSITIVEG